MWRSVRRHVGSSWRGQSVANVRPIVHCECRHTVARTASGAIFAWGRGDKGQLGTGTSENVLAPTPIRTLEHVKVTSMAAADKCTIFVDADGQVHYTGDIGVAELGAKPVLIPKLLPCPQPVSNIACGDSCAVFTSRLASFTEFGDDEDTAPVPGGSGAPSFSALLAMNAGASGGGSGSPARRGSAVASLVAEERRARTNSVATSASNASGGPSSNPVDIFGSTDPAMRGMFDRFLKKLNQQHALQASGGGPGNMLIGRPELADALVEKILKLNAIAAGIVGTAAEREARQAAEAKAAAETAAQVAATQRAAARAERRFKHGHRKRRPHSASVSRRRRGPASRHPASTTVREAQIRRTGERSGRGASPIVHEGSGPATRSAQVATGSTPSVDTVLAVHEVEGKRRLAQAKMLQRQAKTNKPRRRTSSRRRANGPGKNTGLASMLRCVLQ